MIDFTVLGQAQGSDLFTAVIPKADVEERIALLADYGFDAETIDVDTVPVAARLMMAGPVDSLNLLLDVGASETTGVFFKEGQDPAGPFLPLRWRSHHERPFGGPGDLFVEAEARKKRGDTEQAEEQITEACQKKFFASLKNTISSLRMSGLVDEDPAAVWLTGGGGLYRKLAGELSRVLAAPVERVNVTQLAGIKPVGGDDSGWDSMIMNGALALALRPLAKGPGFNFRQGDLHRKGLPFKFDLGIDLKRAGAVAALILLLAGGDLTLSYYADKARLDQLKAEAAALLQQNFPEVTRVVDPAQQFRAKIAEAKRLATASRGAASGGSVLGVMKDLSEQVPEGSDFLITALVFDGDRVDIRGEAMGFDAAETVKRELEKTGRYASIAVSSSTVKQGAAWSSS